MKIAGRGRDGPCGPPPAQIRTSGLRSIRLLARVIAAPAVPSAILLTAHGLPALRPAYASTRMALPLRRRLPSCSSAPVRPVCSEPSSLLCSGPTAKLRASSATATSFPTRSALDCSTGLLPGRRILALPIPAYDASEHAQVSDRAGSASPLPVRATQRGLPRALTASAPESCTLISGLNTGPTYPLSTLHERHYCRSCMTGGQGGWLGLPCWGLAPLPSYRF